MTSYKESMQHDRTAICVIFDERKDTARVYRSFCVGLCYVGYMIGAGVMRKMTFLVRGKFFLLMNHVLSFVTVGSDVVHRSRSFSSLR